MKTELEKLKTIIEEKLMPNDVLVDQIYFENEGKYLFLKVILDRAGGIDLDTIVEMSKLINPIIDDYKMVEKNYILDISSKERKSN